ncbi:hypothetical protein ACS0TY_018159 [Phlomoides rotata]
MEGMEAQVTQMNQQQKAMEFQMGQLATTVGHKQNEEKKKDEIEQENEDDKVSEKDEDEDEEIAPSHEDEEEKGMMKNDKEEMKKKQKKDESEQKVPKWKLARDLKEKRSGEVECDEWGIPKIQDRISPIKEECRSIQLLNRCEEGVKMMKQESSPKMPLKDPGDSKEEKGRKKGVLQQTLKL